MSVRRIRAVGGLATDPAHTMDPEALRVASNVLLHRPGLIQPRFGLGDTTGIATRTTDRRPIAIVPFDGDLVIQAYDSVNDAVSLERGSVATVYSSDVAPPDTAIRGVSSFAEARGSLYFTTSAGVKKLADIGDSAVSVAGVRNDFAEVHGFDHVDELTSADADLDRYALNTDSAVAYRYCWVSEDANGYVRRSSPSARFVVYTGASTGGPYAVRFSRLYLPTGIAAGDRLELYRTENVTPRTSTPGTEYHIVIEHVVTSAEESAGYIENATLYDDIPDSLLGASLYTNPSQGGIQQANEPPPLANHLAWWGDVMWYGNTASRRTLSIEVVSVADQNATNDPDGVHQRTGLNTQILQGDFTSGSDVVVNLDPNAGNTLHGMKVGQYITDASNGPSDAGTCVPALTKIAAIETTVTINNAALMEGDTIRLFGHTFTWSAVSSADSNVMIGASSSTSAANLAAKLGAWSFEEPVDVSASAVGAVVTLAESDGLIVYPTFTGSGMTLAYALQMSANATATSAAAFFTVHDWFTLNGVEFFAALNGTTIYHAYGSGVDHPQYREFDVDQSSSGSTAQDYNSRIANTAIGIARAVNAYTIVHDENFGVLAYRDVENTRGASVGDGAVVFMRPTASGSAFSFSCTVRPDAFRPRASETLTTEDTRARSRLHWSKPQEPEAVPILNFVDIGRRDRDVLALVPTERALLVFKEDGIYAVTGSAPSSWLVDEVDASLRLVAPQATCVLNGICYAWTSRGVMAVTEAGAQLVSAQIGDQLRELQRLLPLDASATKRAFWMTAHERLGLVILGVGDAASDTETAEWFVYHTSTGRWAIWPIGSRCAAYDAAEDRMVHAPAIDAWSVLYEREDEDAATSYRDASLSGLSASIAGTSVTIAVADFGGFVPSEGDVLLRTFEGAGGAITVARVVTGAEVSGSDYVITVESTGLAGTGSATAWHQGYAAAVEWHAQHIPGRGARWSEGHAHLGRAATAYVSPIPMLIGGYSERDTSASTVTASVTATDAASQQPKIVRVGLPRAVVRATHLYPRIEVNTAGALWRLAEIDLHAFAQSQRVAR